MKTYFCIIITFCFFSLLMNAQDVLTLKIKCANQFMGSVLEIERYFPPELRSHFPAYSRKIEITKPEIKIQLPQKYPSDYYFSVYLPSGKKLLRRVYLNTEPTTATLHDTLSNNFCRITNSAFAQVELFQKELVMPTYFLDMKTNRDNAIADKDTLRAKTLTDSLNKGVRNYFAEKAKLWLVNNPGSLIGSYLVYYYMRGVADKDSIKMIFNKLVKTNKENVYGVEIRKMFTGLKIGDLFPVFSLPDSEGKLYNNTMYKGKYVLFDFWASWCKPCRIEADSLVELNKKLATYDFTLLGISLDADQSKWKEAIEKDKRTWLNLIDSKGFKGIAEKLSIEAIPANVLVDKSGKIIAVNIRFSDVSSYLK